MWKLHTGLLCALTILILPGWRVEYILATFSYRSSGTQSNQIEISVGSTQVKTSHDQVLDILIHENKTLQDSTWKSE